MNNKFKIKPKETLMHEVLERVKSDRFYNSNMIPYTSSLLSDVKKYFEDKEDYESCLLLREKIKQRFSHIQNYKQKEG